MTERKYKCRIVTSMPWEKEVYDRYNELLPKGTTIPDEVNEFGKQRINDLQNDKNSAAPRPKIFDNSSLSQEQVKDSEKGKETRLDLLNMTIIELQQVIDTIDDKQTLGKVRRLAQMLEGVSKTKLHKIRLISDAR